MQIIHLQCTRVYLRIVRGLSETLGENVRARARALVVRKSLLTSIPVVVVIQRRPPRRLLSRVSSFYYYTRTLRELSKVYSFAYKMETRLVLFRRHDLRRRRKSQNDTTGQKNENLQIISFFSRCVYHFCVLLIIRHHNICAVQVLNGIIECTIYFLQSQTSFT